MEANVGTAIIDVREDGVYLIVNNPEGGPKVSRREVLDLVESYGIQDMDFQTLTSIFKSNLLYTEVKISSNTTIKRTPESVVVEVSKDRMNAVMMFTPPVNGGELCTLADINKSVDSAGVRFGLIPGILEKLFETHDYMEKYTIAKGKNAVDGVHGYIDYRFDARKKTRKPKELENGKVDFRKLNLIEVTHQGKVLAEIVPAVPGTDGMNINGQILTARPGRPAPPLVKGKNVKFSPDESSLIAEIGGQIILEGKRISISPVLEIEYDVDNSTGDIDFIGSVIIKGNVRTGFTVKATGNIEVSGAVEGAIIESDQNVFCYNGVQGNDKAEIKARCNITAKFVEGCDLEAGGDIIADCIMHSNVKCNGSIFLAGRKGLLVGGKTQVNEKVELKNMGAALATFTEIEVGFDPSKLDNYRALTQEYNATMGEFEKLEKIINSLYAIEKRSPLPENKKFALLKCIHNRIATRERLEILKSQIDEIMPKLDSQMGIIEVSDTVYPGVRILIGNAIMHIRDKVYHSSFRNVNGKILITPLV